MSTQLSPAASQRCHWRESVIGPLPLHVPSSAVSVCSSRSVPVIVGSSDADGGVSTVGAVTTAVWADVASTEPPALEPVTRTRIVEPTSSAVTS